MGSLSYTGLFVLQALAQGYRFGFDIMDVTRLPSGTVYPALRRLETLRSGPFGLGDRQGSARQRATAPPLLRTHEDWPRAARRGRIALSGGREAVPESGPGVIGSTDDTDFPVQPARAGRRRTAWREEWLGELPSARRAAPRTLRLRSSRRPTRCRRAGPREPPGPGGGPVAERYPADGPRAAALAGHVAVVALVSALASPRARQRSPSSTPSPAASPRRTSMRRSDGCISQPARRVPRSSDLDDSAVADYQILRQDRRLLLDSAEGLREICCARPDGRP